MAASRHGEVSGVTQASVAAALLGAALGLVYWPVLPYCYGMVDDYVFLAFIHFGQEHYLRFLTAVGRPLQDWLLSPALAAAGESCNLGWLRLVALLGIWLFSLLIYRACRRGGWRRVEAFAIALIAATLPAMGVYAGWAVTFPIPWALVLGLFAGRFWLEGLQGGTILRRRAFAKAAALSVVALAIYQPAAMAVTIYPAIAAFRADGATRVNWWQPVAAIIPFGLLMGVYFLGYKELVRPLLESEPLLAEIASRGRLVSDFSSKLIWFFTYPLPVAASAGSIRIVPATVLLVLSLGIAGVAMHAWRCGNRWWVLTALSLVLAGFLPLLALAENPPALRLLAVPAVLLVYFALWGWRRLQDPAGRGRLTPTLFGAAALLSALSAHALVADGIVAVHVQERERTLQRLAALEDAEAGALRLIRPPFVHPDHGVSPFVEYGMSSAAVPYSAKYLVLQLLWESYGIQREPEIYVCSDLLITDDCSTLREHPEVPLIDLRPTP